MELFGMPRVDKSVTYPEHMQYDSATAPLRRSPVNKFGSVSGDILSSTAWSALIHRPADDSEPDELPSTVDMDAIKEPLTPMPPPVLTPKPEPPDPSADDSSSNSDSEADSSSSGGGSNTDSDEGSNSGSCSWSNSGSDCGDRAPPADSKARSSCSSRSSDQRSDSDHSTPQNKLFAIKNMEQGGLKFKLSAVEKKKSPPPKEESSSSSSSDERDNSSSDEEADKSSDASQSPTLPRKHITETQTSKPHKEEMPVVKVAKESPVKEEEKKKRVPAPTVEEKKEHFTKPTKVLPDEKQVKPAMTKLVKEETRSSTRLAQIANLRAEIKSVSKSPTKTNNRSNESIKTSRSIKTAVSSKSLEKISPPPATSTGRLRSVRRIPRPLAVQEKTPTKVISGADSCDSDDEDDEEADGRGREGGEITNIAQQLGDSEPHSNIAISEQLQVINQEDLAAILPDVVGVFDGFEDVSGGEGRGAAGGSKAGAARGAPGPGQESSSDMELLPEQEQIVSEAIKRIELDSEGGTTEQQPRPSSASGPDEDDNEEVGYSSSLLQQFVEKTEQLSKGQKGTAAGSSEAAPRRRRGRPPKPSAAPAQLPANDLHNNNRLVMPELEAYMRLDCSVSNVSPDSGIQSVAGSPSHQCSPAWHPPAHSPAPHHNPAPHHDHPSPGTSVPDKHTEKISKLYATTADILGELAGKRGPGRPKGSGRRKRRRLMINSELLLNKEGLKHARDVLKVPPFYRHPNQKTVVNMVESNDELPRLPGMIPGKRGPGRPKKTPPTLEPMLPLSSSKGKKSLGKGKEKGDDRFLFGKQDAAIKSSGSFLNDICERVSKRLDIPLSLARLPKSLSEKCGSPGPKSLEAKSVSRTKLGASLEKRKKGRRKMLMQSRSLALPKGLLKVRQHKHKKRKKMKKTIKNLDQRFIMDLERLVQDFNMMCCINPEAPVKASENPVLPQIFRLKRIVKKRKGSERDRDSGPEVEPSKDKTPTHISLANAAPAVVKRRPKKNNTVETTKNRDRPEANNEQRLPLKKRHYPCEDIPLASTPAIPANEPETTVSSENPQEQAKTLNAKSVIMSVVDKISEKVQQSSGGKNGPSGAKLAPVTAGGKPVTLSKPESKSKVEIHRNSIDEAIEATITRFSHESRSVIVTPKKRHRLEMDKKGSATSPVVRNLSGNKGEGSVGSPQPSKRVVSRSSSTNNQAATRTVSLSPTPQQAKRSSSRGTSKQEVPSGPRQRSGSRGSSETAVTVISGYMQPASNRISTRSSDITITTASNKRVSKLGATEKTEENKPLNTGNVTSATQAVLNKRATREKSYSGAAIEVKTAIFPTQEATKPVHQNTSCLNTRSAIKIPPDAPLITPIPPTPENINSKSSRSRSNKPPAGVFEPSSNADELMSLVSIPPTHVNNMDTVLSQLSEKLKGFESTNTLPAPILKLDESHNGRNRPKRLSDSSGDDEKKLKKRKVIRDIRVHVQKLSPSDLVLKKVMGVVKTKIRRRNRFNRTGFPVKKKKKKKLIIEEVLSTSLVESKIVPINEKEKPKVPVITSILDLPSPVICVKKIDDIIVKEEDKVDKLKTEVMVEIFKEELRNVKSNEEVKDLKLKEVKEEKTVFEKQIMEKQDSPEEFTPLSQRVKRTDEPKMNTRLVKRHENHKAESKTNNKTERTLVGGKSEQAKVELRKSSRRLMMIKARQRVEASMRRKRKLSLTSVDEIIPREKRSPSPELPPPPLIEGNSSESRLLATKRLRRPREDLEKDDSDADSTRSRKKPPPRWRKKYLTAGLFSDCFKEDEPRKSAEVCKSRLVYNPEEHRHGLLPPPYYCGKWVRQRKIHFQLPHDLWWLHTNSQLPGRDIVPSWNYKKIRTNVYYDLKPNLVYEAQACSCKVEGDSGCGDDCINRMIYTECSSEQCPCSDKCCNQRIMRHEWAPGLDKFMTKDKGWGVKTKYAIKSGEFILEYVGEVVSDKEFKNRMASRYQHDTHHYCLNLDGGLVIDGHRMGGDGRFVNHSCEPNCEIQKWSVNGLYRMALFALRDIQPHEELTYDYNFSLFNPAEGQKCKCGSKNCRGVIGGKSQRVSLTNPPSGSGGAVGIDEKMQRKPRKARKSAESRKKEAQSKETVTTTVTPVAPVRENKEWSQEAIVARLNHLLPLKPLTPQHRAFVLQSRPFLLRNLEKVSQLREKLKQLVRSTAVSAPEPPAPAPAPLPQPQVKESEVFLTQLNALSTPRNIRTRRLAQAQDNPEMTRTAKLAHAFKLLYNAVAQAKEEDGELLATPLVNLPSKRKLPQYFQRVTEPIDLTTIEHNIVTGVYKTVDMFDQDMTRLFSNNVRFYGRTSDIGIAATRLRKEYGIAKLEHVDQLREILGDEILPPNFLPEQEDPGAEEEDVIRCICGMFRDEGLMIQCERCLVWQHTDCVKADTNVDKYLCERCSPREVDYEIPLEVTPEYASDGQKHFMTLLRGDLQLRQGDTVYVLRDIPNEETGSETTPLTKHNYKTIKNFKYSDCDIFRIERLWKDEKGQRFAFGHHYLRPHETFHEPTRKFFPNELMRIPLYEVVPLDLIMGHCYVLDINTFCKGRPVGADPNHIYICEYRVDKGARLFAKLAKSKTPPVCLKNYAFDKFDQRLKITRTYTPHGTVKGGSVSRGRGGRSAHDSEESSAPPPPPSEDEELPLARVRDTALASKRVQQKAALNVLLLRLLARLPSKQPLDVSYLLEPGRRHRKRPAILSP